ncbi:MAG: hypothetical protein HKN83_06530 [Gammaproteobacteria bacterium]|nr:hypothetical protein [Gammaproteobacteria bacterium]
MHKYYLIPVISLLLQSFLTVSFAEQELYEVPPILQAKDAVPEELLKVICTQLKMKLPHTATPTPIK